MKVFVLFGVLCDWTCGCIIVSAKNKEEAIKIILEKTEGELSGDMVSVENIKEKIIEVTEGFYEEVWGGG